MTELPSIRAQDMGKHVANQQPGLLVFWSDWEARLEVLREAIPDEELLQGLLLIGYYHVSDTYIALFSSFISCGVWEAVHILDGLLENESEIRPDTLHADTQGQSEPVFGLAHLLSIKLMPRIRNWQNLTFYLPDENLKIAHIHELFSDTILIGS